MEEQAKSPSALIRVSKIYESLRYNDYSAENGLGEIIDNSVEARAANIHVDLVVEKVKKEKKKRPVDSITKVIVTDDGDGMDRNVLHRCLVLGESIRTPQAGVGRIGRFGVGMTLGSISLARRVEVYSRPSGDQPFLYTFIDLDDVQNEDMKIIPAPVEKDPPGAERLKGKSGTVVVMARCDRLDGTSEGFANYLGRTYRKFIERGVKIFLDGRPVYLHDPLYMAGPTRFDVEQMEREGIPDRKAKPFGEEKRISLPVPDREGETADVIIRMSILPKEWRTASGDGGSKFAKERKIDQNEGISILRADREVLYGIVPYIIGPKGRGKTERIDRWWGLEISFPPELDDYFRIRYIKRGAEPVESLRDKIRAEISNAVRDAQAEIRRDREGAHAARALEQGAYGAAERTMAKAEYILPRSQKGRSLTPAEHESKLDQLASTEMDGSRATQEEKAAVKEAMSGKPYIIKPVLLPPASLFETVHLINKIVIKLNVAHPFYKAILAPLCGNFEEESSFDHKQETIKNAILLLLFSYAKAESMFDKPEHEELFNHLRLQWGAALATAIGEYQREEHNG